jgi:arogenate dehydrogenase (NADP+), plant
MFGPESGKHGWGKLPFVFDKVRVADDGDQAATCDRFLSIFEQEVTLPELMISLI